jgi:cyclopropane-fatty-acyl-phospholipid synthase
VGFAGPHRPAHPARQQPRRAAEGLYGSWRQLLAARVRHWLNRNSKAGSKRNIMAHYDLGNDFYRLWLDPSMSYSAPSTARPTTARWKPPSTPSTAHPALPAQPGQSVLEIGCGWGGFAELAAAPGCRSPA